MSSICIIIDYNCLIKLLKTLPSNEDAQVGFPADMNFKIESRGIIGVVHSRNVSPNNLTANRGHKLYLSFKSTA